VAPICASSWGDRQIRVLSSGSLGDVKLPNPWDFRGIVNKGSATLIC
jgi:hypothetical protein